MIKTELVSKLKDEFNLNTYESKVWVSLIKKGISSVGEISRLSGVPRNRTYDVLDSLERKGFAMKRIEKPLKYIGVKPLKVIEKIKRDVMDLTKRKFNTVSNFSVTEDFEKIEKVYLDGKKKRPREDIYGMFSGKRDLDKTLILFLKTIKKELFISMGYRDFKLNVKRLKRFLETGKKIEISLFDTPTKILPDFLGKKVKSTNKKLKFFIKDSKQILLYISKDKVLLINSSFFVNSFLSFYENS